MGSLDSFYTLQNVTKLQLLAIISKESCNSYFYVTPKIRRFTRQHCIPQITQKIPTAGVFHLLELIIAALSFRKIFSLEKIFTFFFQYFRKYTGKLKSNGHILEGLHVSFNWKYWCEWPFSIFWYSWKPYRKGNLINPTLYLDYSDINFN